MVIWRKGLLQALKINNWNPILALAAILVEASLDAEGLDLVLLTLKQDVSKIIDKGACPEDE
jgi:hypothetical protein